MEHTDHAAAAILVVEDNDTIRRTVAQRLAETYRVADAATVAEALRALHERDTLLGIVDLRLPDGEGMTVVDALHERGVPVIILSSAEDEQLRLRCFAAGVDDYVGKPFSLDELEMRVAAVLRRARPATARRPAPNEVWLDEAAHRCGYGSTTVELTRLEFLVLAALMRHRGRVLSRDQILEHAWGHKDLTANVVDVHLHGIRKKLGPAATQIQNVWGVGYRLL